MIKSKENKFQRQREKQTENECIKKINKGTSQDYRIRAKHNDECSTGEKKRWDMTVDVVGS